MTKLVPEYLALHPNKIIVIKEARPLMVGKYIYHTKTPEMKTTIL